MCSSFRVAKSGLLRAAHLPRHKWPGGISNPSSAHREASCSNIGGKRPKSFWISFHFDFVSFEFQEEEGGGRGTHGGVVVVCSLLFRA